MTLSGNELNHLWWVSWIEACPVEGYRMVNNGFEPRVLICTECNEEFAFTVAAQEYFAERGYTQDPRRCKFCHTRHKKDQRESRPQKTSAGERMTRQ